MSAYFCLNMVSAPRRGAWSRGKTAGRFCANQPVTPARVAHCRKRYWASGIVLAAYQGSGTWLHGNLDCWSQPLWSVFVRRPLPRGLEARVVPARARAAPVVRVVPAVRVRRGRTVLVRTVPAPTALTAPARSVGPAPCSEKMPLPERPAPPKRQAPRVRAVRLIRAARLKGSPIIWLRAGLAGESDRFGFEIVVCSDVWRGRAIFGGVEWWTHKGSNLGPLPCEGNALPLSYASGISNSAAGA